MHTFAAKKDQFRPSGGMSKNGDETCGDHLYMAGSELGQ